MRKIFIAILVLISVGSFGQKKKIGERLNSDMSIDSFYVKLNIVSDSVFSYSNDAFVAFTPSYYIQRGLSMPAAFSNFHPEADEVFRNNVPRVSSGVTDSTLFSTKAYRQKGIDSLGALKQNNLVSGSNIKTINGSSVLGSGDLTVSGSTDSSIYSTKAYRQKGVDSLNSLLSGKASLVNGGIGYTTGNGGTVTQLTSKGTAVTINKLSGRITLVNSALAAGAEVSFNVNNTSMAANDVPVICMVGGGTVGAYGFSVTATGANLFTVTVTNLSTGSLSEAIQLQFVIIKGSVN